MSIAPYHLDESSQTKAKKRDRRLAQQLRRLSSRLPYDSEAEQSLPSRA
jgi:hypothetical protein